VSSPTTFGLPVQSGYGARAGVRRGTLEWIKVYERQIDRWQTLPLTAQQRTEVRRLAGELAVARDREDDA